MAYIRLSPDDRRAQLLALAIRMFTERPYDDFSMDDLAAAAGVSKGLLYHYFPSKRALYMEGLRAAAAEMMALGESDPGLPLDEQLEIAVDAYLTYVRDHAAAYRALLRGGIGTDPEVAAVAEEVRQAIRDRVLAAFGIDQPRPRLRLAVTGWVGLVEAISLEWLERQDLSQEELLRLLTAALPALLDTL
ncbi:MAG TPA: helix-turn-helix domain-containing protein [Candidatus Dormibacteraeota bacterium]|nr:helix-turn-helix domain-containing protein [Candidatus Dormibacteraeota bacterium]